MRTARLPELVVRSLRKKHGLPPLIWSYNGPPDVHVVREGSGDGDWAGTAHGHGTCSLCPVHIAYKGQAEGRHEASASHPLPYTTPSAPHLRPGMNPPHPNALKQEQAAPVLQQTPSGLLVGGRDESVPNTRIALPPLQVLLSNGSELPNESGLVSRPSNQVGSGRPIRTVACMNCRKAAKRCDQLEGRPCIRCLKLGLEGCMNAPASRAASALSSHWHGALPTRTLIHTRTTVIEEHRRHWQEVTYDPVSGASWSTFFTGQTEVRTTSTVVQTQISPPTTQLPAYHAPPPMATYLPPPTLHACVPGAAVTSWFPGRMVRTQAPWVPAIAPAAAPPQPVAVVGHPTAHNHRFVHAQAPRVLYLPVVPIVDPRFNYQAPGAGMVNHGRFLGGPTHAPYYVVS